MADQELPPAIPCEAPDFPVLHSRTQGFGLGTPRHLTVTADRVLFLRGGPDDPVQSLWVLDGDGERLLVDASGLQVADLTPEERARRERARERGSGVVTYATDAAADTAVFLAAGDLTVLDVAAGTTRTVPVDGPVVDPRLNPSGSHVAYVVDGSLRVVDLTTDAVTVLADDPDPDITWGLAEFVAAEEMDRTRGFWWAPDGTSLIAERVDVRGVDEWWIAGPVDPATPPTSIRYPGAGTPNAEVALALLTLDGTRTDLGWDTATHPYLADVVWTTTDADGPALMLAVQSRDQQEVAVLSVDLVDGTTTAIATERDQPWVELVGGAPTRLPDGRLVRVVQTDDTRMVEVDGAVVGDAGLLVAGVLGTTEDSVIVSAHVRARPWCTVVARVTVSGEGDATSATTTILSDPDGVAGAAVGGGRLAIVQRTPGTTAVTVEVTSLTEPDAAIATIASMATPAPALPVVRHAPTGGQGTPAIELFVPASWQAGDAPLPVLMDPYGGPGARRVIAAGAANLTSAWFAANGFAVIVADGPGAPGQSLSWTASIAGDFATPTLDGQIEALQATDTAHPGLLDLDRVAIRGWSFGGYLSALAVLRRPDVFGAAVSGAPVTEWRLYDTHYTERYLGHPDTAAEAYDGSSIVADAHRLSRPLLVIHGLADDNVVAAHTLRLSRALLEAGRPHEVLPLSGVTHFTPSATLNANILLHQLDFLRRSLPGTAAG